MCLPADFCQLLFCFRYQCQDVFLIAIIKVKSEILLFVRIGARIFLLLNLTSPSFLTQAESQSTAKASQGGISFYCNPPFSKQPVYDCYSSQGKPALMCSYSPCISTQNILEHPKYWSMRQQRSVHLGSQEINHLPLPPPRFSFVFVKMEFRLKKNQYENLQSVSRQR